MLLQMFSTPHSSPILGSAEQNSTGFAGGLASCVVLTESHACVFPWPAVVDSQTVLHYRLTTAATNPSFLGTPT